MSIKNKLSIIITTLGMLIVFAALTIFAETNPVYSGKIEIAEEKLQDSISAKGPNAKRTALDLLSSYMKENPIDPKSDGYDNLMNKILNEQFLCAKLYLANIDVSQGTARNKIAINKLNSFVKEYPISKHTEYNAFFESYSEKLKQHEKVLNENIEFLDKQNLLDDYKMKPEFSNDFSSSSGHGIRVANISGVDDKGNNIKNFADVEDVKDEKYFTLKYRGALEKVGATGLHTYMYWYLSGGKKGMVFDFDFTTFDALPENGIRLEAGEDSDSGGRIFPTFMAVSKEGNIKSRSGDILLSQAVVKGEWLHFSVVFHPDSFITDIYVEYELIGSFDCRGNDSRTFTLSAPRFGQYNRTGEFSIDNMVIYPGTCVRTLDRFEKMNNDEKFICYTEYMNDDSKTVLSRKSAYDYSKKLIDNYYDSEKQEYKTDVTELKNAVDLYLNFDYDKLVKDYSDANLIELGKMTSELSSIRRIPSTFEKRKELLIKTKDFLAMNEGFITTDKKYNDYLTVVNRISNEIAEEEQVIKFNINIMRLGTATTITSMQKYYYAAKELVDNGLNISLINTPGFLEFQRNYITYLNSEEKINALISDQNSYNFIYCIDLIKQYDTEQDWLENHDYVEKYILIARKIIYSNNYNRDYSGFSEAFSVYEKINNYFYNELQEKHIEVLKEKIENYEKSDNYVERLGICAFIHTYVENNDIDKKNAEISKILTKYEEYQSSLKSQEEEYILALRANTDAFIKLIDTFKDCKGYTEIKEVYNKAELYYYAMNVGTEEAEKAVKIFDNYGDKIEKIEFASVKMIEITTFMDSASDEEIFALLVEGLDYKDEASDEVKGGKEALAKYSTVYNNYMSGVDIINAEIDESLNAVGSVRVNTEARKNISVIMKIVCKK